MKPIRHVSTSAIDWQQVRSRLARAIAATEEALHLSPERARAVMDERARALARVSADSEQAAELVEVVVFTLANERYAIETRHVREVVRFTDFTRLPAAPEFLVGITNLRGHILAVIDLRKFFGVAVKGLTDLSRVIVLGGERPEFGVLADTTHEVTTLRADAVLEPPGSVAGVAREYLRGITQEALIVLDGAVLLADPRLFIDQGDDPGM
jgi:purine-binding chemotaxis protein CheW